MRAPADPRTRPRTLLCGPFPEPGAAAAGGYARANELLATSPLASRVGVERLPVSPPAAGSAARRLALDLARARRTLRHCPAPVFHLTAQYQAGTWREWALHRLARRAGRAFLLDIRAGCFPEAYARQRLRRPFLAAMIRGAHALAVEGRRDQAWLRERFGREALWLPNFVSAAVLESTPPASLAPPAEGEPFRLAYAGRITPEKGLHELVDACATLRAAGVRLRLALFGDGRPAEVAALEERARKALGPEGLELAGALPYAALLRRLGSAHLFVFPSRWWGEGHANAVNEAMQAGLPVVASTQGFLADVVTPECGWLVPPGDVRALARAIGEALADPERLRTRGRAARERARAHFSDAAVLPALDRLWDRLARGERVG